MSYLEMAIYGNNFVPPVPDAAPSGVLEITLSPVDINGASYDGFGVANEEVTDLIVHGDDFRLFRIDVCFPNLKRISFPELTQLTRSGAAIIISQALQAVSISAPLLTHVTDINATFTAQGFIDIALIDLPLLEECTTLNITGGGASLTTLSYPSLVSCRGMSSHSNAGLTTLNFPLLLPGDVDGNGAFDLTDNALSAASMNHLLARCVANPAWIGSISARGGTTQSPTGQGLVDKQTLLDRGCGVDIP